MSEQAIEKFCPFLNRVCLKEKCELWTDYEYEDSRNDWHTEEGCAFRIIANVVAKK